MREQVGSKPGLSRDAVVILGRVRRNVQTKAQSQVGRNISLIETPHEAKETRRTLLVLRPGHDLDVTVNFLA